MKMGVKKRHALKSINDCWLTDFGNVMEWKSLKSINGYWFTDFGNVVKMGVK